ncbi:outer membrane beta-barrel protein [Luteimonas sp. MC1750]|uniref:outer membrane beta-barrel protein n=1 Tax=Luteimonas sp. MC1750 TaxID=2799326 RepID=UPI0018F1073B|nr:outer membrane beta-barrel protein [Luteimonas sp. MC1750]MBJ6983890.1 outer membrane beta-barrel protein [Luteimonas sp. MC1750]QQO06709.1 outer membrane beta-barrel protein [Luteimonas sp. MC1750]
MHKPLLFAAALLATACAPAFAADGRGGYIRAEIGQSDIDLDYAGASASEDDTSFVFSGGYWFNRNIAIEGHVGTLYTEYLGDDLDLDLVSIGVGVAAKHGLGQDGTGFFVGGRAGIARITAQLREDDWDVIDDEHSNKPYFGASVGYDFSPRFGVSLNWDRRQAEFDGVDLDIDTLAIGGELRF